MATACVFPGTLQAWRQPAARASQQQQAVLCALGSPKLVFAQRGASETGRGSGEFPLEGLPRPAWKCWDSSRPVRSLGSWMSQSSHVCGCMAVAGGAPGRPISAAKSRWHPLRAGLSLLLWTAASPQIFSPRRVLSWVTSHTIPLSSPVAPRFSGAFVQLGS